MKIGIFSEYFPKSEYLEIRGGAEARTYHIAKQLARNNEVTIITSKEIGTRAFDEILGMKIFRVGNPREYSQKGSLIDRLIFIYEAIKLGKELKFDIVEGTNFLSYPIAWKIGEYLSIPKVITYHDVWIDQWVKNIGIAGYFGEILEKYSISKKWNLIIANSDSTKNKLINVGIDPRNIITVFNGVDVEEYAKINVEKFKYPTICTISRLVKYKRIDDLIKSVNIIKNDVPNIKLKIIGTGPEEKNLKKLANELNLVNNIEFLGFVENHQDVIKILKASHVFVLPSIVEGFGMVVIEAMAAGIPYVASNIPPINEVTQGGKGGYLFEPKNYFDLANYIHKLLSDNHLRDSLILDMKDYVEQFDWEKLALEIEESYIELLSDKGRRKCK